MAAKRDVFGVVSISREHTSAGVSARNCISEASAGTGLLKKSPCPSSHPHSRRIFNVASVSMPSAITDRPRASIQTEASAESGKIDA
jgi:hypothetical protein